MIQILALLTMERPKSLLADDLSDQKVFIVFSAFLKLVVCTHGFAGPST